LEKLLTKTRGTQISNQLLSYLPHCDKQRVLEQCKLVNLVFGETLCCADETIEFVYFPITGFISLLANNFDGQFLEIGLIGTEGMLGATLALGSKQAPMKAIVQGTGTALQMDADVFVKCLNSSKTMSDLSQRYLFVLIQQLSQTVACNSFHEVKQRLAKWLLMTQDRTQSNDLQLSHQFLAKMLGVRRSAVTIAAGFLQNEGLITYKRGHIQVLSRAGLEKRSCQCFRMAINTYKRHLIIQN
jgi:CRP-like cAMP-binding protein